MTRFSITKNKLKKWYEHWDNWDYMENEEMYRKYKGRFQKKKLMEFSIKGLDPATKHP